MNIIVILCDTLRRDHVGAYTKGCPLPEMPEKKPLHGINLLPVVEDATTPTREVALAGMFGKSVTLTDGKWVLHQSPLPENQPLYWHGYHLARFLPYNLGPFVDGCRPVIDCPSWPTPTWLSDKREDPNELVNLAEAQPDKLNEMQQKLKQTLIDLKAPVEQVQRLGLNAM